MFHVFSLIILGAASLVYIYFAYHEEWFGPKFKSNKVKIFNRIGFAIIGLYAAFTPYLFGVSKLFLGYVNFLSNGVATQELVLITFFTTFFTFIAVDMFRSLDGKSGVLYKMPRKNPLPLKNYKGLVYRLDMFFGLDPNS